MTGCRVVILWHGQMADPDCIWRFPEATYGAHARYCAEVLAAQVRFAYPESDGWQVVVEPIPPGT